MTEVTYRISFHGEVLTGHETAEVKQNLMALFKMPPEKIERFFAGGPVVVKSALTHEMAKKYQETLARAGADCHIEAENQAVEAELMPQPSSPEIASEVSDSPDSMTANVPSVVSTGYRDPGVIVNRDQVEKGKELGKKAYGQAREATHHAIYALKVLFTDPMGGQREALGCLGLPKALSAGIVFISMFVLAAYLLENSLVSAMTGGFGVRHAMGVGDSLKILLSNMVPPAALCASFYGLNRLFGEYEHNIHAAVFTTGVALIPTTLVFLVILIIGMGNLELVLLAGFFGSAITILLVNSALLDIYLLSTQKAVLLTPTVVLATAYLSKVLFTGIVFRF